jgi:UDP-N-acetylmuramate dehydrogenase
MVVNTVRDLAERINITGSVEPGRPLAELTTFRVGGPAELLVTPADWEDLCRLKTSAEESGLPFFLLGGGANILVADAGISGVVASTREFTAISVDGQTLTAEAGAAISDASAAAGAAGLSGLEFIYAMPGSVGGAVWMNARCYGVSIDERIAWVEFIDSAGKRERYYPRDEDFGYKRSPFQDGTRIITRVAFSLRPGQPEEIRKLMEENKADRERKGHFRYPCAGSVFKNNRAFGAPSGRLIDALGLKGVRIGQAMIAPFHGNIIINLGGARASDILALIELAEKRVSEAYGFSLEREVLLVGDWPEKHLEGAHNAGSE